MGRWWGDWMIIWLSNSIVYHHSFLLRYLIDFFDVNNRNIYVFLVIWVLIFTIFCWRNYLLYWLNTFVAILFLVAAILSFSLWRIFLDMDLGFDELRLKVYSHVVTVIFSKWIKCIQPIGSYLTYGKWKTVRTLWYSCTKPTYID